MPGLRQGMLADLRDGLEETVLDPSCWPGFLEAVSRASGSEGASLMRVERFASAAIWSPSVDTLMRRYFDEGWNETDHRLKGLPVLRERGVTVDQDFTSPDEFETLPFYRDLLATEDFRWFAGIGFQGETRLWCLALQRKRRQGPFEPDEQQALAALAPALRRAALLASTVEAARMSGLTDAFDLIDRAVLVLGPDRLALRWNAAFERLLGPDLRVVDGRLIVSDPAVNDRLDHLAAAPRRPAVSAVVAPRREGPALLLYVLPLTGATRSIFSGGNALLLACPPDIPPGPAASILQAAFSLTPAEARLAAALAGGASVAEAAGRFAVSPATTRAQLKAIFAKTGVSRQVDLVRLASALALKR